MSLEKSKEIFYPGIIFKQPYKIDTEGNIYTPWQGWKIMRQIHNKSGYMELYLYTENKGRKCFKVHRLVMETFNHINNSEELQVNHIDGNKTNNNLDNLEWCTKSEKLKHAFKIKPKGEKNPNHKLTQVQVNEIRKLLKQNILSHREIANKYNVSKGCISHIKNNISWKN